MTKIAIDNVSLDRRRAWDRRPISLSDQDELVATLRRKFRRQRAWRLAWTGIGLMFVSAVASALVLGLLPR